VIYFRHAATEAGGVNGAETLGDRGVAQRNLFRGRRGQSGSIGEAFEELDMPVGEVLSSPFFRNIDTAEQRAFSRVQPRRNCSGSLRGGRGEEPAVLGGPALHPTRRGGQHRARQTPLEPGRRSAASRWRRARPRSTSRSATASSSCGAPGSCPRAGKAYRDLHEGGGTAAADE
jgi:hypothetical protein